MKARKAMALAMTAAMVGGFFSFQLRELSGQPSALPLPPCWRQEDRALPHPERFGSGSATHRSLYPGEQPDSWGHPRTKGIGTILRIRDARRQELRLIRYKRRTRFFGKIKKKNRQNFKFFRNKNNRMYEDNFGYPKGGRSYPFAFYIPWANIKTTN